ncbi:MAG: prepilin-type N-terminal cleavage/methylation domain-containing protein [Candidatus Berkelbacteria bacterium]
MIKNKKAFTLIELILTVAVVAVLVVVIFIVFKPTKILKDSNDSRRASDIQNILVAVHSYFIDNKGSYPTGLLVGMAERQIGTAESGAMISKGGCNVTATSAIDLTSSLSKYLKSIPIDPNGTSALTGYSISIDSNGIVTVKACDAENNIISVSQ